MNVIELRRDLHNLIDKITDDKILHAVKILLSEKANDQMDWWDTLSDEEREEIKEGIDEADRGEVIPHEEIMNKYKKWM